jgi:fatty acid desaturase
LHTRAASAGGVIEDLPDRAEHAGGTDDLDALVRTLVSDLHTPRPRLFWIDLGLSAIIGWAAFVATVLTESAVVGVLSFVLAALALYRGVAFTHELSHLRRSALPGFETVWNMVFGVPMLLPSFTYIGVHQSHHNLATYGTKDDPEYLPFASSRRLMVGFAIQSAVLLPLLLLVRFLVLAPIGLLWPRFHRWLEVHASSFSMNPEYRREVSPAVGAKMRRWEAVAFAVWMSAFALIGAGVLPSRILAVWVAVLVAVSFLNTARVLGAHEYETDGTPRSRYEQLQDSIDTPGGPWTELWAPVGLRYHALHHYFPGIPYHSLGTAYRRLIAALPTDSVYRESTSPSLRRSLTELYAKPKRPRPRA